MPADNRSFFDIGAFQQGIAEMDACAREFKYADGRIGVLSDTGGGYLSKALAAQAAAHMQLAITTQGANVPGYTSLAYNPKYAARKKEAGYGAGIYQLSGELYNHIKVLNRRYVGGRGSVAGISQTAKAERPNLGEAGGSGGDLRSIAAYAFDLEFYGSGATPRKLLSLAMADFITQIAPVTIRDFAQRFTEGIEENISKKVREAQAAQAAQTASASTSDERGIKTEKLLISDTLESGGSVRREMSKSEINKLDSKYKSSVIAAIGAEEAARWEALIKDA